GSAHSGWKHDRRPSAVTGPLTERLGWPRLRPPNPRPPGEGRKESKSPQPGKSVEKSVTGLPPPGSLRARDRPRELVLRHPALSSPHALFHPSPRPAGRSYERPASVWRGRSVDGRRGVTNAPPAFFRAKTSTPRLKIQLTSIDVRKPRSLKTIVTSPWTELTVSTLLANSSSRVGEPSSFGSSNRIWTNCSGSPVPCSL